MLGRMSSALRPVGFLQVPFDFQALFKAVFPCATADGAVTSVFTGVSHFLDLAIGVVQIRPYARHPAPKVCRPISPGSQRDTPPVM